MLSVKIAKVPYRANAKTFSLDTAKFSSCYGNGIGSVGVRFNPDPDRPKYPSESLQIDMNSQDARVLAYRLVEKADEAEGRTAFLRKLQDYLHDIKKTPLTSEARAAVLSALGMLHRHADTKGRET